LRPPLPKHTKKLSGLFLALDWFGLRRCCLISFGEEPELLTTLLLSGQNSGNLKIY